MKIYLMLVIKSKSGGQVSQSIFRLDCYKALEWKETKKLIADQKKGIKTSSKLLKGFEKHVYEIDGMPGKEKREATYYNSENAAAFHRFISEDLEKIHLAMKTVMFMEPENKTYLEYGDGG